MLMSTFDLGGHGMREADIGALTFTQARAPSWLTLVQTLAAMSKFLSALLLSAAIAGCSRTGPAGPTAGPSTGAKLATTPTPMEPTATLSNDADLAYLLTHLTIVSESPLPHELPAGSNSHYRIIGATQQGNCVGGCPPSTIYVAAFNYTDHPDGHIRLCKVDGIRWFSRVHVASYKPEVKDGVFLQFDVRSNIEPRMYRLYRVSVAPSDCSIEFLKEVRSG